jgi:hypothetical protein
VLNIASTINSIQDLAIQLDLWMTSDVLTADPIVMEEPMVNLGSSVQRHSFSDGMNLDRIHRDGSHSPKQTTSQSIIQDGEQRVCLTLKELIQHG